MDVKKPQKKKTRFQNDAALTAAPQPENNLHPPAAAAENEAFLPAAPKASSNKNSLDNENAVRQLRPSNGTGNISG